MIIIIITIIRIQLLLKYGYDITNNNHENILFKNNIYK